jgi:PAS domain S-box-containing protein
MSMSDTSPEHLGANAADLRLLYDVIHEFSSTLDLPTVLGQVLSLTVNALGGTRGSVFMLDERGNVVRHILARRHLPLEIQEELVAVVMARGLAGWVYRHRQGSIADDARTDERWHYFEDDDTPVGSAVTVPLIRRGVVNGIISVEHTELSYFDDAHLELVTAIASQAAIAIENARLYTQARGERDTVAAILDSVGDAILVVDGEEMTVKMVNPAAVDLLGMGAEEAVGRPLDRLLPNSELVALLAAAPEERRAEVEIRIGEGRHFVVAVSEIPQVGRVAALHDVTHFRELDESKSDFVSTVSHDLKAPLSTIMGYAWMLAGERELTEEQRKYVMSILSSAERMRSLVNNLLDLAQIEAGFDGAREACYLQPLVARAVDQHAALAAEKHIRLEMNVAEGLPSITANGVRISQAVGNLISNAIKYSPEGGEVTIEATQVADAILVRVTDSGVGIAREDQSKLFRRFSRVGGEESRGVEGTGLGLAIVRSVAESYGGRVWVESELGKGSSFYMLLPADDSPA